jgi:phosphopantetheine adenylyltransferase
MAAFLDAIEQAGSAVLGVGGTFERIDRGDVKLLFEHGEHAFLAVVSKKETPILREKMKILITEFETRYRPQLENWMGTAEIFEKFRLSILREFNTHTVTFDAIPSIIKSHANAILEKYPGATKSLYREMLLIINLVDGRRTIQSIQKITELPLDHIQAIVGFWMDAGIISINESPELSNPEIKSSLSSLIESSGSDFQKKLTELGIKENQLYGLVHTPIFQGNISNLSLLERRFVSLCTGENSLAAVALLLGMPYFDVFQIASSLKNKGLQITKKLIKKPF